MKKAFSTFILCSFLGSAYPQWILLNNEFTPNSAITAFDSIVIAGAGFYDPYDLAVSYDFGESWNSVGHTPSWNDVYQLYTGESWLYACTARGVFRAAKDDLTWSLYNEGLSPTVIQLIEKDSILLAISDSVLFIRGLEDNSWSVLSDNIPQDYITGFDFDGTLIVMAGSDGVCESWDMGASWSLWTSLQFAIGVIVIKGDTIIHASPGGVTRKLISTGYLANVSSGLVKLWTPPPGYDYYGAFEQFHKIGDNIFLCGETGVYKLKNDQWYWEHTGLEYWTNSLADNGEVLFAAKGYDGIWGRPLDQLIVHTKEFPYEEDPVRIYPNPTSDHLAIRSGKEIQRLTVYNELGQVVMIKKGLINDINLDLTGLDPGIYFLNIQTKSCLISKKVIVLRVE